MSSQINKKAAIFELWRRGVLTYKMDENQKKLRELYLNSKDKINVWLLARRSGKSYTLLTLALELCNNKPGSLVKYIGPTKMQIKGIIRPLLEKLLEDCPEDLKPTIKESDYTYYFPNGSELQMAGADSGHAEKLRGGDAHLILVDEAGSIDNLQYIIRSILLPTTLITKGKIILASTPPVESEHDFLSYIEDSEAKGTLIKRTIYDNPRLGDKDFKEAEEEMGGKHTESFRREYLCVDENTPIKTKNGYIPIKDINIGEEVLTHTGNYRKVLNKFPNKLGNRKVYSIKNSYNLENILTEDHKILIASKHINDHDSLNLVEKWEKIQDIDLNDKGKRIYTKFPVDSLTIESSINEKEAYLAGWYISEGHLGTQQQVIFSINHEDPFEKIAAYSRDLFDTELKKYTVNTGCFQATLNSKKAKEYFTQFGKGAKNKFIPNQFKFSSNNIKKSLIKALFLGDGYYNLESGKAGFASISHQLILDISDILFSLNIPHSIQQVHEEGESEILGRKVYIQKSYAINLMGKNFSKFIKEIFDIDHKSKSKKSRIFIKDNYIYSRITSIKEVTAYNKAIVYDIEVEEDHSYVGPYCTFHNCEIIKNADTSVIPEFDDDIIKDIVKDWPKPPYFDCYVAMDLGFKDLTCLVFGYYDFRAAKVVIEDELVTDFKDPNMNLKKLCALIKEKEEKNWTNIITNEVRKPSMRVSDIDYIVLQEISKASQGVIYFSPANKYDKEAGINNIRTMLSSRKIVISPKCVNLIRHLKNAKWDKAKKGFARSAENGHYDLVDALSYFLRAINYNKNPYPASYGLSQKDLFIANPEKYEKTATYEDVFRKMLNMKPKGAYAKRR